MTKILSFADNSFTRDSKISKVEDHQYLLQGYLRSHAIRNHSPRTIAKEKKFLEQWFSTRSLHTWEAMKAIEGRKLLIDYGEKLLKSGMKNHTIRAYLGILMRYFSFVLSHPFLPRKDEFIRIENIYNPIDQPLSEFDFPSHSYDGEQRGIPLDPERLYDFYQLLGQHYLLKDQSQRAAIRAKHYCMAVVAGESGLRVDELLHLEVKRDLFFESNKIQTRFAKSTNGSGKRARTTLFPPLARDTVRYYLKRYWPQLEHGSSDLLFPNGQGKVMTYQSALLALKEMVEMVQSQGFPISSHMSWHWFRRIFATRFIERFPHQLSILVNLLGHSTPNTVHKYIRHSDAWMDQKIQDILEGAVKWPSIGN